MSPFKLLIDTNIVIGLEDAKPVKSTLAELFRLSSEFNVDIFIDNANYDDVKRDKDADRRAITLSKLGKFQKLRQIPSPSDNDLNIRFGPTKKVNDTSDVRLLVALDAKAIDFLVTEDVGLHRRADFADLGGQVLTVEEALEWLRHSFQEQPVNLPYVTERKAYEIDKANPIFASLEIDYPGFSKWFDACRKKHRDCWVLEIAEQIAGIVIRKDETHAEAGTRHAGPKILKVCTFKVLDEYRGEKFGELLLKQILWFAQRNDYDLVYLTVFPKHGFLINLLNYYGFHETRRRDNSEVFLEKVISKGPLPPINGNPLKIICQSYPRFHDGAEIRKFCVPIKPSYHRNLFPEIAFAAELPLFPHKQFSAMQNLESSSDRTPGNTIRKVYICRSKIKRLRLGDLLFFYMSKDQNYAASQTITTIGVVESVVEATKTDDLMRLTAKRSVFSGEEIKEMAPTKNSPVKVIDFLLIGHVEPFVNLKTLLEQKVFNQRPPQSISGLTSDTYSALRPHIKLGFKL